MALLKMRKWWCGADFIKRREFLYHAVISVPSYAGIRTELQSYKKFAALRETLIQSLSDFTLEFLCIARNSLTRIASYLRRAMTKLCIKILVEADSVI